MMRFTILKAPIPSNRVKPFMAFAQGAQGPIAQAALYCSSASLSVVRMGDARQPSPQRLSENPLM